jgi:acetyltransferase-like isoleucine patch superfamily enzyme
MAAAKQAGRTPFVHPAALCEGKIGSGTRVWAFAQVMRGAEIGAACNIGGHAFIEAGAVIGDRVTIKNGVMVWDGIVIEDDAFIGPGVIFTNDRYPRSPRAAIASRRYVDRTWLEKTTVGRGASIGAGAAIGPGVVIGAYAMIAAGAIVVRDVPAYRLVAGNPARSIGWVDAAGQRVTKRPKSAAGVERR